MKHLQSDGFTILELMIATTVFSVIMLLCTYGMIQIGRTYYKGATLARTQNTARAVMDNITQAIQYGSAVPVNDIGAPTTPNGAVVSSTASSGVFCVGSNQYTFTHDQVSGSNHGLVVDTSSLLNCTAQPLPSPTISGKELLGENMRLTKFQILNTTGSDYHILLKITYGNDADIELDPTKPTVYGNCKGGLGSQFCASSQLATTVHRRL